MSRKGLLPAVGLLAIAIVAALAVVLVSSFASGWRAVGDVRSRSRHRSGLGSPARRGPSGRRNRRAGHARPADHALRRHHRRSCRRAARSTARRSGLGACGHRVPSMGDHRSAHARAARLGHGHASADDVRIALHGEPVHPSEPVGGARIRRSTGLVRQARRRTRGSHVDRRSLAGTARVLAVRGLQRRRFHGNHRPEPVAGRFHLIPRGDVPDLAEPAPASPDRSRRASRCRRLRAGLRRDPSSPEGARARAGTRARASHRADAARAGARAPRGCESSRRNGGSATRTRAGGRGASTSIIRSSRARRARSRGRRTTPAWSRRAASPPGCGRRSTRTETAVGRSRRALQRITRPSSGVDTHGIGGFRR